MISFNIYKTDEDKYNAVIIMKTTEAPFERLDEISQYLKDYKSEGNIVIDQLLHTGNSNERFILGHFNGQDFETNSFRFEKIDKHSKIRKYVCEYLRNDPEVIDLALLTQTQKKLIIKGCNI